MMEQLRWSTWAVPENLVFRYVSTMFLVLYGLPWFFGLTLTALGFAMNLLWADFIFFHWYRSKLIAMEMFKEYERQMKWRKDNGEDENEEDEDDNETR